MEPEDVEARIDAMMASDRARRREHIATAVTAGLAATLREAEAALISARSTENRLGKEVAVIAVAWADALIAELEK